MLLCHSHCDLDLYPIDPKINREHLLSMTNIWMKFEEAGPYQTLVIDLTRLHTTDGRTDLQTAAKQYTPSSSKGGIIVIMLYLFNALKILTLLFSESRLVGVLEPLMTKACCPTGVDGVEGSDEVSQSL